MSGPHADDPISYYGTGREDTVGASHSYELVRRHMADSTPHSEGISTGKGKRKARAKPATGGDDKAAEGDNAGSDEE